MKCCMSACRATGEPEPGYDFFCCTECLDKLAALLEAKDAAEFSQEVPEER